MIQNLSFIYPSQKKIQSQFKKMTEKVISFKKKIKKNKNLPCVPHVIWTLTYFTRQTTNLTSKTLSYIVYSQD